MSANAIVIVGVGSEDLAQMRLAQDEDVVQAFSPDRADEPFSVSVLVRSKYWNGREPVGWRHQIAVPGDGRLFRTVRDAVSRGSMWGRGRQWIGRASWPT
jgi:hypothetical protein